MAKIIKYQLATNTATDEIILTDVSIKCPTEKAFDANLPIVQAEAYNGVYTVDGEFDPEPETDATTDDVLNALLGV